MATAQRKAIRNKLFYSAIYLAVCTVGVDLFGSAAFAGATVELSPESPTSRGNTQTGNDPDSPAWHRKLWDGSFDKASDASGAAAKNLEGLDYGDCKRYLEDTPATEQREARTRNENLYWACVRGQQNANQFAQQARSIQKQQKVMSMVSKASDVAALGSVGAVIYGEMGVKQNNQAYTFDKAANIQRKAGQVSYVTGAADLSMGAYAYVAHKNKLEQIKRAISGSKGGVRANTDPAVVSSVTNALEASKQAAYNHMLYGAGKMAAGYGMMYLSKRTAEQAERMHSIEELQYYNSLLANRPTGAPTAPQQVVAVGSANAPYYQNNQPNFVFPNSSGGSQPTPASSGGTATFSANGAGTGSSVAPGGGSGTFARSPASGLTSGKGAGGGGSSGGSGGASLSPTAEESSEKDKVAKEAVGSSFEMQLTGGPRPFAGGGSNGTGDSPAASALPIAGALDPNGAQTAATGLSPSQVYQSALEGIEGSEQGSMSGVNGKRELSLFEITKSKLTKMFQIGNVGIPKNVEVKN